MVRKRVPGFRFSTGRLMIFTEEEVKIVDTWPGLEAVRNRNGGRWWAPFTPCFRFLRPKTASQSDAPDTALGPAGVRSQVLDPAWEKLSAFLNFRRSIPPEIATAVEHYPSRQLALLRMCNKREQAKDLLSQNPALGFGAAHGGKFRPSGLEQTVLAARLSKLKQREIARLLGFPDSQAWVNILSKMPADIVGLDALMSLREAAGNSEVEKLLCHLATLNAGVIALITNQRMLCLLTAKLMAEVAQSPEEKVRPQVIHLMTDIINLHSLMDADQITLPFRSIDEVRRRQQEAVDQYARFLEQLANAKRFPDPPLPGSERIVPIVDASELWEEGLEQHNCVGSYGDAIRGGRCYIYRVLSPQRATLSVAQGSDGCWQIQQLSLSCNRPVSVETWQFVQEWLNQFSLSI